MMFSWSFLNVDFPGLGLGRFREGDGQNSFPVVSLDIRIFDGARKGDRTRELTQVSF